MTYAVYRGTSDTATKASVMSLTDSSIFCSNEVTQRALEEPGMWGWRVFSKPAVRKALRPLTKVNTMINRVNITKLPEKKTKQKGTCSKRFPGVTGAGE